MKSEHRHELKTNELAEWISNFPSWTKENAKVLIPTIVVLVHTRQGSDDPLRALEDAGGGNVADR